ncbi:hypothetical protein [Luteolibacter soli]|uniref:Uncharacterized protein n=1 Tax=Luteolibacter soli TaxID=3135280 RepID=A0ABU9B267_9BACT
MMTSHLLKNGEVVGDLIPSDIHHLPLHREECWHDCTVVTNRRVEAARATDVFGIKTLAGVFPFCVTRSRIGVDGWDVEGKVLY